MHLEPASVTELEPYAVRNAQFFRPFPGGSKEHLADIDTQPLDAEPGGWRTSTRP